MNGRIHAVKSRRPGAASLSRRTWEPGPAAEIRGEPDFEGSLDRAERFGHHLGGYQTASTLPIQRRVSAIRSGEDKGKFKSSLTGQVYDTREEAEEAESAFNEERETRARERQNELDTIDFSSFGSGSGSQVTGFNPFAEYLLRHPAHFGPLMTQGGQVKTSDVSKTVGQKVLAPGTQPNRDATFHSGQNTYSGAFSNLELFGESLGVNAISKSGEVTPEDDLPSVEKSGRDFRDNYIFTQGKPGEEEHVHFPDSRDKGHAEAQTVHSDAMDKAIEDTGDRLNSLLEGVDGATSISENPTEDEIESFSQTLGLAPFLSASTEVALNRSSCKSGSGYDGGCNQEMADVVPEFYQKHEKHVGKESSGLHRALGLIGPSLSVAGPYERGTGSKADISVPLKAGMRVRLHNKFDYKNTRKPKPLGKKQKELYAEIRSSRKRLRKERDEELEKGRQEAPSWGGQGPKSLKPFDNWGVNHPLHFHWNRDQDGEGGSAV